LIYNPGNPLIVQGDKTILVEVNHPLYEEVRDEVSGFAELEKSPEYVHTYRISPLSLWNAAASGMKVEQIISILEKYSKYDLPQNVLMDIKDYISRYGKVKLLREDDQLVLVSDDTPLSPAIFNFFGRESSP
jgi:DNA excision repair protein ERCC-3